MYETLMALFTYKISVNNFFMLETLPIYIFFYMIQYYLLSYTFSIYYVQYLHLRDISNIGHCHSCMFAIGLVMILRNLQINLQIHQQIHRQNH